ncbi:MAG: uroporphyrinogen-III C-methyltransferase [Neisseriaceae bacterium]|nr:uroporphyrinogen-III C-methyltransferase [Neisseriaceae bacterium]
MSEQDKSNAEIVNIDMNDLKVQPESKAETPQPEPAAKREKVKIEKRPKEPETTPVVIKQGGGKGWAALALLFSLVALGASGFLFVQGQNVLENARRDYAAQLDKAALGESDNARRLNQAIDTQQKLEQHFLALDDSVRQTRSELLNTQTHYQSLSNDRLQWLINETDYTLNATSQQILWHGNTPAVIDTLTALEQRLSAFDFPELLPLKKAISDDLRNLKARPAVNTVAVSLRLERLLTDAENLPLLMDRLFKENTPAPIELSENQGVWYKNLWQTAKDNMGSLVQIRKIDNPDIMALSADQVYFIRKNIELRLLDARIALMQHQDKIYQNDLTAAITEINRHFDTAHPMVQAWLAEAEQLKAANISQEQDGDMLKNSLSAVRKLKQGNIKLPETPAQTLPAPPEVPQVPDITPIAPSAVENKPSETTQPETLPENKPAETKQPETPSEPANQGETQA